VTFFPNPLPINVYFQGSAPPGNFNAYDGTFVRDIRYSNPYIRYSISRHLQRVGHLISFHTEIQELRHKSQSSGDNAGTTNVIDQSLMSLDERLESVEKGIKTINETLEPLLQISATPTVSETVGSSENAALLRKQATLVAEWEAIQNESDVLREELKEDKWLTVFRTVTDQADGMMSSLEKAVNRCQVRSSSSSRNASVIKHSSLQEFIWQVHRKGVDEHITPASMTKEKTPITLEVFTSLLDSFEAKKK
jgi:hypothetical protein